MGSGFLNLLAFYALFALFCLPGYLIARALDARDASRAHCLASGFVFSLAAFALVAWPCLWLRQRAELFWSIIGPYWLTLSLAAAQVFRASFAARAEPRLAAARTLRDAPAADGGTSPRLNRLVVVGYLAWGAVLAARLAGLLSPLAAAPVVELLGFGSWCVVGWFLRPAFVALGRATMNGAQFEAPRAWRWAAVLVVGVQMAGAALAARPDWDDTSYLSAVNHYAEGGELNREGFTLPVEDFVPPHTRLLAWELWGATLCRYSGVHPMVSHHTLLPPVLVMLAAAANWQLLAELLSRRLAPLAVLGLSAYWLFGVSTYDCPGSYLLTRSWQGKTMLWLVGLPLLSTRALRYFKDPRRRNWCACVLASVGALAMSSSAVFLVVPMVPALWLAARLAGAVRRGWQVNLPLVALVVPELLYGLLLRSDMAGYSALTDKTPGSSWQQCLYWGCVEYGTGELLFPLLLPVLAGALASRLSRGYLVMLPLVLMATVLNPLAYEWMARDFTSYHTYYRLFWLVPLGPAIGCATALVAGGCATARAMTAKPPREWPPLLITLAMMFALASLPGRFVWSCDNEGPFPGLRFAWGTNLYKVPDDLLPIVQIVAGQSSAEGRLLVPEHLAQYFVPYNSRLRCVSSRPTHTFEALAARGHADAGRERVALTTRLLRTSGTEYLVGQFDRSQPGDEEAARLLDKYIVTAIVVDDRSAGATAQLTALGFRIAVERGIYQLWRRTPPSRSQARREGP